MNPILAVVLIIVALLGGGVAGFFIYNFLYKKKLGDAKTNANKMLESAIQEAKILRKDALLEAKEEIHKQRQEAEREIKERRAEMQRGEHRITQKEEALEKKEENLDKKEEVLDRKIENIEEAKKALAAREEEGKKALQAKEEVIKLKEKEVLSAHDKMLDEIAKVANLTRDEAKKQLVEALTDEAKHDAAKLVREIEADAKEEADKKARNIVTLAVQKCAVDHSAEHVVSVVPIPGDDIKGRIIGREGRNIRALENATGIELIIDDTPEAVVLSGFDPVRREIAKISLEKLISDGRIHPARIEEVVEKTKKEVDQKMKEAGDAAVFEAGVYGLHPDVVKLIGRLKYRTSYGQNVLKHSLEVAHLAGLMAAELGADVNIAKRGGLLHDLGKAVDHEVEGTHISIGVDLAKKYKESNAVIHCIHAHHGDVEATTLEAILVQTADAISGARPGARRESMENYIKRLEKLETIANAFKGVEKSFAISAGREVRVIVKPEQVNDEATVFMAKEIAKQIESEMEYPGQIKVNVIRELRSTEFAK